MREFLEGVHITQRNLLYESLTDLEEIESFNN